MHGGIDQEIGFNGTSGSCLKILQGNYNATPDTYDYTTAKIKHLRRAPNIIELPQATVPKKDSRRDGQRLKNATNTVYKACTLDTSKHVQSPT